MFYFIQFFLSFPPFPSGPTLPSSLPFSPTDSPLTFFPTLCFSFSPTPPTILTPGFPLKTTTTGDDEAQVFVTRFWSTSSFFLAILFNFFFRSGGNPFITRLQCLADNKPMKATFEPRGSFEKSFFANLSPSLSFLWPSSRHSYTIFRFTPPFVFNARSFFSKDFRVPYPRPTWKFHAVFFSLFSFHYPLCVFLPCRPTWNSF